MNSSTEFRRKPLEIGAAPKKKRSFKKYLPNYVLLLPFLFFYVSFMIYPLLQGFIISFYDWKILGEKTFIGLKNYIGLFNDPVFFSSLWHTVLFVILSTPVLVVMGFVLALLVNLPIKGQIVFRFIFFAPIVLAVSVVASVWKAVLGNYGGMINSILQLIGVSENILWLGVPVLAWVSIIVITLWWTAGFNMVLFLAGLQDIPEELYEAAKIDGANAWDRLWNITIPSLKRITKLVVFLQVIASFKIFSQVYLVTAGGPAGATKTIIQYIYETGFDEYRLGPAAAMSYIFFLVLLVWSLIQFRLSKEN